MDASAPISLERPRGTPVTAPLGVPADTIEKVEHTINWGGVIKGVAIITAVAVAGIAVYSLTGPAVAWFLNTGFGQGLMAFLAPAGEALAAGLTNLGNFLMHVPGIIGGFLSGTAQGLGLVSTVSTSAISSTTALAAGAGTAALGVGAASGQLENLHLVDKVPVYTPAPETSATTLNDGAASLLASKKAVLTQQADAALAPGHDLPPLAAVQAQNATHVHDMAHNAHTAFEVGHHSLHGAEHASHGHFHLQDLLHRDHSNQVDADHTATDDSAMPDTPDSEPTRRGRSWRDKLSNTMNHYQQALHLNGGSHGEAVLASKQQQPPITQRSSQFAQALTEDRARLDAALGETSRS